MQLEDALDSDTEETSLTATEAEMTSQGSLFPTKSSKAYLEMDKCLAEVLNIKLVTEAPVVTDIVHQLVQADLPVTLFSMLPVHVEVLKEASEHPAMVSSVSKQHDTLYKVQQVIAKCLCIQYLTQWLNACQWKLSHWDTFFQKS